MSAITITQVPGAAEAAHVLTTLRSRVYADHPAYRLPSEESVLRDLARARFRTTFLAAASDDGVLAFVAARVSPDLRDDTGRPMGLLGPFESLKQPDAALRLLGNAVQRLRAHGAGTVLGPISGDTWHSYRVNIGPWEDPPFLLEPYNPPYYGELWTDSDFEPYEGYHTKRIDDTAAVAEQLAPKIAAATEHGYRFEPFRIDRFEDELDRVYAMSCVLFADNPLYVEIPRDEFLDLYRDARPLIDAECSYFAVAPDGTDAGFVFGIPDPTGAVGVKTLGVLADHRRAGLGGALTGLVYRTAAARGLGLNLCLMHDDNVSSRLDGGRARVLRRYRLYRT